MQAQVGAGMRIRFYATNDEGGLIEVCRQHLANALKYSSAFPVVVLSALQRGTNPNDFGMSEEGLFRLW